MQNNAKVFKNQKNIGNLQYYEMFKCKSLTDVTLVVENKHVEAHKLVLASNSLYFKVTWDNPSTEHVSMRKNLRIGIFRHRIGIPTSSHVPQRHHLQQSNAGFALHVLRRNRGAQQGCRGVQVDVGLLGSHWLWGASDRGQSEATGRFTTVQVRHLRKASHVDECCDEAHEYCSSSHERKLPVDQLRINRLEVLRQIRSINASFKLSKRRSFPCRCEGGRLTLNRFNSPWLDFELWHSLIKLNSALCALSLVAGNVCN